MTPAQKRSQRVHVVAPGRDQWLAGYAAALSAVIRLHDKPEIVQSVLDGDGLDLAKLRAAGADRYDLAALRKAKLR